ncbi:hypothetical protein [Ectothiorhodospira shaposhnikovii]|uniref:hypothetical protein n=1 Tax=Ectothiorhodospira shaposhnikovii TaxID=1054 RepID=UPI001EE86078|nr:hypothetical protein [Ectothiorhodospira shaposhnikovii]MCG5513749.1 hypothetical protein [Ectothiorhodospira shaposhnikovii]
MSQVVSIRVPEHYEEACTMFQKEANLAHKSIIEKSVECEFMVFFDESSYEIRCEGKIPDSVFSALVNVKDMFGGRLFYEEEEWNAEDGEVASEAKPLEKILIVLAIIFFPITLIYILLRVIVWIPFKVWKATR